MTTYRDNDGLVKDAPVVERTVVRNGTEARQGSRGIPVLVVLLVALILAMIVWGFSEMYGTAIAPAEPEPAAQSTTANPATTPPGATDSTPAPDDMQPAPTTSP